MVDELPLCPRHPPKRIFWWMNRRFALVIHAWGLGSDDARYEISQLKELLKTLFPWKKASVRHPWVRRMAEQFL
ncbi:MAG: hypothetical protein IJU74_06455 [Bacteroidales bacterium]|nr:hypothetical protein [Bacteroidales bacterium]